MRLKWSPTSCTTCLDNISTHKQSSKTLLILCGEGLPREGTRGDACLIAKLVLCCHLRLLTLELLPCGLHAMMEKGSFAMPALHAELLSNIECTKLMSQR